MTLHGTYNRIALKYKLFHEIISFKIRILEDKIEMKAR
jgi:hypothetical protein